MKEDDPNVLILDIGKADSDLIITFLYCDCRGYVRFNGFGIAQTALPDSDLLVFADEEKVRCAVIKAFYEDITQEICNE